MKKQDPDAPAELKAVTAKPRTGRPRLDGRAPISSRQVLEAAAALFVRHGYSGTSIRMIADQLGAHPTSIFHRFPSKDAVLDAVIGALFEQHVRLFEDVAGSDLPADVALFTLLTQDLRACTDAAPSIARLLLLPELRSPDHPLAAQCWGRLVDVYARVLERGQDAKLFAPGDPCLTAEMLLVVGMTPFASLTLVVEGRADEVAAGLAKSALRAVLADPARMDAIAAEARRLSRPADARGRGL